jgi:hypothetical protein
MHRKMNSSATGRFWVILFAIGSLVCSSVQATEDRLADWDDGHCQKLVQAKMGSTIFEARLAKVVADQAESEKRWVHVSQTVQTNLTIAAQHIVSIRQFVLDAWSKLNVARRIVRDRSSATIAILPKTAAIKTVHNLGLVQWWTMHQDISQRVGSLQIPTQIAKLRCLQDSIAAGRNVFNKAFGLTSRWASEITVAPELTTVSSKTVNGSASPQQDEYWNYYSDCDHWQVTFELR